MFVNVVRRRVYAHFCVQQNKIDQIFVKKKLNISTVSKKWDKNLDVNFGKILKPIIN